MIKRLHILLFCCCLSVAASAQRDSARITGTDRYIRLNYDNDFFSATDRYYTQGIKLEMVRPALKYNPLSHLLIPINRQAVNYYGLAIEDDGFTPKSIRHDTVYVGERPYACTVFLSSYLVSNDKEKQQRLTSQLDLGVIGPIARGHEMQQGIHYALNNIQPLGWQYQIANDAVINYDLQYEKGFLVAKHMEFIGTMGLRAGTLYDDINMGSTLRIGLMQPYFDNLGMTKSAGSRKFQCYVFLSGNVRAVQYNATMQGGVFEKNSVYTIRVSDINRIVGRGEAGIVIAYNRFSVEYSKVHISPEFYGGLWHGWGHVVLTYCF